MLKKVLIITYYWPPSGGGGVWRWLKFAKYLREYGWEPVIYTPSNPEMPATDETLGKQIPQGITVLKQPVWEPYNLYKKFTGQKKSRRINTGFLSEDENPKITENISVWIRGNFFIPDARKFWVKPSVKYLKKYLSENPVDAVVSTGPPHSMHLIALGLKRSLGIKWVADFRDPWTNIDFYHKLKLTARADKKHSKLEMDVLKNADAVVTVSWNWAEEFKTMSGREIEVITNGFDSEDFDTSRKKTILDDNFSLVHIGAMNSDRNPTQLWEVLGEILRTVPGFNSVFSLKLIGGTDVAVFNDIKKNGLLEYTELINYLPHASVLQKTVSAQLLILPLNNTPNVSGIIPGKLYEYLAAKRPVLCIGPTDGDSAKVIEQTAAGKTFNFGEKVKIKDYLINAYNLYKQGKLGVESGKIDLFDRKNLSGAMAELLDSITYSHPESD